MSFARGDLARRAALADNLAVPEPWSSNDDPRVFAAIRDLRNEFRRLGITDEDGKGRLPDFLLDYEHLPPIKPTTLDRAHARNSSATRWDQNGNLVEEPSDTLRLQRDPATQEVQGLLYEPQRTQLVGSPQDITNADWDTVNATTNANVGSAKGQTFDEFAEDSSDGQHALNEETITRQLEGDPFGASVIVKANGRNFCYLQLDINDDDASTDKFPKAWFDLSGGVEGTTKKLTNATVIEHSIEDIGGGWYRIKFIIKPDSSFAADNFVLELANGDGVEGYTGDGTSGIYVMHAQAEVSREVTTPILDGNATRGADAVDYRFSFPDRTTGVAFSIEQQSGGDPAPGSVFKFGTTPENNDLDHGVLMCREGLLTDQTDGYKQASRNTDEVAGVYFSNDETIDRFQVANLSPSDSDNLIFTVRQIAIHTRPHTAAQKDTLRDQYLTQP